MRGISRIPEKGNTRDAGYDFLGQLERFRCEFEGWIQRGSRDVPSRSRQAGNEPAKHGVRHPYHHDRSCRCHLPGGQARRRALGNQNVNLETNQLEREIGKALDLAWCIAALQNKVPALDITDFTQTSSKLAVRVKGSPAASVAQEPYAIDLARLLCTRSERQRNRCGADKRDEFSALHLSPEKRTSSDA